MSIIYSSTVSVSMHSLASCRCTDETQVWTTEISLLHPRYCSPEYTFPRQQEVINFAVSTAFELVTLSPRTLVVCGSYSVGKEKVFLGECLEDMLHMFFSQLSILTRCLPLESTACSPGTFITSNVYTE